MKELEKIAVLQNEVQARVLESLLNERGIPFLLKSYHDSALDGLCQASMGWGHIEASLEDRDEIIGVIRDMDKDVTEPTK